MRCRTPPRIRSPRPERSPRTSVLPPQSRSEANTSSCSSSSQPPRSVVRCDDPRDEAIEGEDDCQIAPVSRTSLHDVAPLSPDVLDPPEGNVLLQDVLDFVPMDIVLLQHVLLRA